MEKTGMELVRELTSIVSMPKFPEGNVPIKVVAKVVNKDAAWVREGIELGYFPVGTVSIKGKCRRNFYISPKKLWEFTGYLWDGKE